MDEVILLHQDESWDRDGHLVSHNKFWRGKIGTDGKSVETHWGRVGAKGQRKTYVKPDSYAAENNLSDRAWKKRQKGYEPVTEQVFKCEIALAQIVGTANKIGGRQWVEVKDKNRFVPVDEKRLQNPKCNPGMFLEISSRKYGDLMILFDSEGAFYANKTSKMGKITEDSEHWDLVEKAQEALGHIVAQ